MHAKCQNCPDEPWCTGKSESAGSYHVVAVSRGNHHAVRITHKPVSYTAGVRMIALLPGREWYGADLVPTSNL
jgi:hypothetical protein